MLDDKYDLCQCGGNDGRPRYKHDCERCIFLGQYNKYDLYFCTRFGISDPILARFSSERLGYVSCEVPTLVTGSIGPALKEALPRAKTMNLASASYQ